jgi:hypothetical protein
MKVLQYPGVLFRHLFFNVALIAANDNVKVSEIFLALQSSFAVCFLEVQP